MGRIAFFALLLLPGLVESAHAESERPLVLVSIPPQAFFVSRLAGDLVEVQAMLPAGVNHETYEPQMKQLRAFNKAALYIKVGHPAFTFETLWIDKLLASNPAIKVVDSSAKIKFDTGDFHFWTTPQNGESMANEIASSLESLLPQHRAEIEQAGIALGKEIEQLDVSLNSQLLPFARCPFLTFHPAWSYFARRYGLEQLAIEKEGKEPGMVATQALIASAKKLKIHAFIIEPSSPHDLSEQIAKELQTTAYAVDPLKQDWIANLKDLANHLADKMRSCRNGAE